MAIIVELSLQATDFPLGRLLTAGTETQIEFERIVPVGTNAIPLFWAWNIDFNEFEHRVRAHEQVQELVDVEQIDDRRLYLLNWGAPKGEFFEGFTAAETIIRSAYGYNSHAWEFEILFPRQEDLTTFQAERGNHPQREFRGRARRPSWALRIRFNERRNRGTRPVPAAGTATRECSVYADAPSTVEHSFSNRTRLPGVTVE